MSNPNFTRGIGFLVAAPVVCIASISLIVVIMAFHIRIPEILGFVLYISGPLPIIPVIIAAIGAVLLVTGCAQDSRKRKRPPD